MAKVISGLSVAALVLLTGCGGSSGSLDDKEIVSSGWKAGVYDDSDSFKNKCESPRTGRSQITNLPFPDQRGNAVDEKNFLRSWSHETYLWYKELPDINPANSDTPQKYFEKLKTSAKTTSGKDKDYFHFYEPTESSEAWEAGISYGYGLELTLVSDRVFKVVYVQPNSPAATAGVKRGDEILELDNYVVATESSNAGIDAMNDALAPDNINESHKYKFKRGNSSYEVTLTSAQIDVSAITKTSVIDQGGNKVGYIQFNSFIEKAQDEWVTVINNMKTAGVNDLVVDMRYNGGGLVSIASMVGYMIGGSNVSNKTFIQYVANDQYAADTPVKFTTSGLYGVNQNAALPTLNFNRVYVLSTEGTCSASELVVNSLRGAGVNVFLVGDTTCGKPYGFTPEDNCGTTYYTIQFKGVNAKNYGDYVDGFTPSATDNGSEKVKGCFVSDNLNYELGDASEPLLSKALTLIQTGGCDSVAVSGAQKSQTPILNGKLVRSPRDEIAIFDL